MPQDHTAQQIQRFMQYSFAAEIATTAHEECVTEACNIPCPHKSFWRGLGHISEQIGHDIQAQLFECVNVKSHRLRDRLEEADHLFRPSFERIVFDNISRAGGTLF